MAWIGGKVLISVEDHLSDWPYISVRSVSCSHGLEARSCLSDDVALHIEVMGLDQILSKRQRLLPEGTRFLLAASAAMLYTTDYWGEHDSSLELGKIHTMYEAVPSKKQMKQWEFQDRKSKEK